MTDLHLFATKTPPHVFRFLITNTFSSFQRCLVDSQIPDSRSHFLLRQQDDKLHLVIDAFRFHNEDRGEVRLHLKWLKSELHMQILIFLFLQLYITCHLNAVPANDQQATNKACTFVNGR